MFELCDVLSELLAEELDSSYFDTLEYRVHRVLALLERDFPVSLHVIVFHLLHHLPNFLSRFGPANGFWMYPFERFNSWISRRLHNRRYPESTVIETYHLFELTSFLSHANLLPHGSTSDIDDILEENESKDVTSNESQSHVTTLSESEYSSLKEYYGRLISSRGCGDSVPVPSNSVTICRVIRKVDCHGRVVTYFSFSPQCKSSSCIIYTRVPKTDRIHFGEIKKTFKHVFLDK